MGLRACVLIAALLLCACGRQQAAGLVADAACGGLDVPGARCLTVRVPESRDTGAAAPEPSAEAGRVIPIRVVVLPATGSVRAADPVIFLAGGPGQAASEMANGYASSSLRARRDLIFPDQRGTGGSNDLRCRFYDPDNLQSYFDDFMPSAKVRECRAQLQTSADLRDYTTANSVLDLDDVRSALGYQKVNVSGGSYGTRLALEYARRFENRVRTLLLDGAVPPSVPVPEDFGALAHASLDAVLDECLADDACRTAFPGIREETKAVFARLGNGTVKAALPGGEVTLQRQHVGEVIRYMLYSSRESNSVPLVLHAAYNGDFGPIARFLHRWRGDGTFDALYISITCAEDVPFVAEHAAEKDDGTFLTGYRVRQQRAACAEWPRGKAPDWRGRPVTSAVPTLILSGMLDPVTPPANGDEIARTLGNAVHLRIPSGGHGLGGLTGIECVHRLKQQVLDRGSVDGLDTSCVSRIRRRGFVTAF
jgi:pimeloyl-ACP methyl ester carboxylesterase